MSLDIDRTLALLASSRESEREEAISILKSLCESGVPIETAERLIDAVFVMGGLGDESWSTRCQRTLLDTACANESLDLERLCSRWDELKPGARVNALACMCKRADENSARLAAEMIERACHDSEWEGDLPLSGLSDNPRHPSILLPALVKGLAAERFQFSIIRALWCYLKAGVVDNRLVNEIDSELVRIGEGVRSDWEGASPAAGVEKNRDEACREISQFQGLVADVLGYLESDASLELLQSIVSSDDLYSGAYSIVSLRRRGCSVDAGAVHRIASDAEARWYLVSSLERLDPLELRLIPDEFLTLEAMAEAKMVEWLCYPTEYGHPPEEIVLEETFDWSATDSETTELVYVFRFRQAPESKWHAGASGPWIPGALLRDQDTSLTFSHFEPWESKSAEDHLVSIVGQINDAWRSKDDSGSTEDNA